MIYVVIAVIVAYLVGSMPTAFIFGKIFKGIDIRDHGSGNVGATNVVRTVGKIPGMAVFVIDFLKGYACVALIPFYLHQLVPGITVSNALIQILVASAAIAGHIWTIFLRFKGGKGVATTIGAVGALSPIILAIWLAIWLVVFGIWRYVSLASISAAVALPVIVVFMGKERDFIVFASILCIVIVYAHRSNIKRLIHGSENK